MMSQHSGDPFAALIRVNTVVKAVVGNRDIRGEMRVEYQGRQILIKTRETVQSQNTMIKQRKRKCQPGEIQDFTMSVSVA